MHCNKPDPHPLCCLYTRCCFFNANGRVAVKIVQPSLYHPKQTVRVLQIVLLLYRVPAMGMARPLIYGGQQYMEKKSGQSTQARETQPGSAFILVSVCLSHLLSNLTPLVKTLLEPFLGCQPTYRLNSCSKLGKSHTSVNNAVLSPVLATELCNMVFLGLLTTQHSTVQERG